MPRTREAVVFVAAFAVLASIAADRLLRPTRANHHALLAQAWLEGRLDLPGLPPGAEDFAKVTTLTLKDGSTVLGVPCRTAACAALRSPSIDPWRTTDGRTVEVDRREIVGRTHRYDVSFPPGPTVLLLPLVALVGPGVPDVLITVLLGALCGVLLVRFLDRVRGTEAGRGREHLLAAAALVVGSPACFVAASGSVWFLAQTLGMVAVLLALDLGWQARRPLAAGLAVGLAMACRPHLALVGLVFGHAWWTGDRSPRKAAAFLGPVVAVGGALAVHNFLRFGDPFEFGHRYLDVRWQAQIQTWGLFSLHYLPRNLAAMLVLPPAFQGAFPWLRVPVHGLGLPWSSPWLLGAPAARTAYPGRTGLLLATFALAIPGLLYHNSGLVQFSFRFALDWLPLGVAALALGGATGRRWFPVLVGLAAVVQIVGAIGFVHFGSRLFRPDFWPFPPEIE